MNIGKHSMNVVHRVVKSRKRAGAHMTGQRNRRLVTLKTFKAWGPTIYLTRVPVEKERLYHFTKGIRVRNA